MAHPSGNDPIDEETRDRRLQVPHAAGALEIGRLGIACLAGDRDRVRELFDAFEAVAGATRTPCPAS